jgi:hypothetical protein
MDINAGEGEEITAALMDEVRSDVVSTRTVPLRRLPAVVAFMSRAYASEP